MNEDGEVKESFAVQIYSVPGFGQCEFSWQGMLCYLNLQNLAPRAGKMGDRESTRIQIIRAPSKNFWF